MGRFGGFAFEAFEHGDGLSGDLLRSPSAQDAPGLPVEAEELVEEG